MLAVQCRLSDEDKRRELIGRLERLVHMDLGIDCTVELVPPRFLPRTSSGKLSRSKARQNYVDRRLNSSITDAPAAGKSLERAAG